MPCSLLGVNRRFGGTYRLHLQGRWRWRQYVSLKRRLTLNGLHGLIPQKMVLFITTTVRSSNPQTSPSVNKRPSFLIFKGDSKFPCCTLKVAGENRHHKTQTYGQYQYSCHEYQHFRRDCSWSMIHIKAIWRNIKLFVQVIICKRNFKRR
jgi:hypothetical protein